MVQIVNEYNLFPITMYLSRKILLTQYMECKKNPISNGPGQLLGVFAQPFKLTKINHSEARER